MIKGEAIIKNQGTFSNGVWNNVIIEVKYPMSLPNGTVQNSINNPPMSNDFIIDNTGFVWKILSCSQSGTSYTCSISEQSISSPTSNMSPNMNLTKGIIVTPNSKGLLSPYYHDSFVAINPFRASLSYNMKKIGSATTNTGTSGGSGTTSGGTSPISSSTMVLGANSKLTGNTILFINDNNNATWSIGYHISSKTRPFDQRTENYTLIKDPNTNKVYGLFDFINTSGGSDTGCNFAVDSSGKGYLWGSNYSGYGGLGHTNAIGSGIYELPGINLYKKINGNGTDSVGLDKSGYIWLIGSLINSNYKVFTRYDHIFNKSPFIDVCMNGTALGCIGNDGYIYTIGSNYNGQLGIGSFTSNYTNLSKVASSMTYKKIYGYMDTFYAIDSQDYLWTWGSDIHYILEGQGNYSRKTNTPVKVSSTLKFSKIAISPSHCLGLALDGVVYGWGSTITGIVGNGDISGNSVKVPTKCINLPQCRDIATTTSRGNPTTDVSIQSYALDINYKLWAWGYNGFRNNGTVMYPYYFGPNHKSTLNLTVPTIIY